MVSTLTVSRNRVEFYAGETATPRNKSRSIEAAARQRDTLHADRCADSVSTMNEAKEVDAKASSVIAVPDGDGITGKSDGGVGVIGAIATGTKDTPPTDGTPAAKRQKVAGEVTPPDVKETKKIEDADTCKGCKLELLEGNKKRRGGKCDRCNQSMCDDCTNYCGVCDDVICDKCSSGHWHNELTYCEICYEWKCGKCGGDEFVGLCGDPSEGMVCRECEDKAEMRGGYF